MYQKLTESNLRTIHNTEHLATSDKYNTINTAEVVADMEKQGFKVVEYRESNFRKEEKENKVKHMVRMAIDNIAGIRRDIVIFNSHDSSTSLRLNFGAYRAICMNTLVFGDSLLPEMRIKHTMKDPFSRINEYAYSIREILEQEADIRAQMESTRFSAYDMERFAREVTAIREDESSEILDMNDLNTIQRPEDIGKNLWLTFNRCQENLIKGNYRKLGNMTDIETGETHRIYKKAKEIKSPAELLRINKSVHELALNYL